MRRPLTPSEEKLQLIYRAIEAWWYDNITCKNHEYLKPILENSKVYVGDNLLRIALDVMIETNATPEEIKEALNTYWK